MNKNKVLIVVAHTDDETLGIGGTIARHVKNGDNVFALSMTDGVGARLKKNSEDSVNRIQDAKKASNLLGFKWLKGGFFPDNGMESIPILNVIRSIEEAKELIQPTLIYTHSSADLNIDQLLNYCKVNLI